MKKNDLFLAAFAICCIIILYLFIRSNAAPGNIAVVSVGGVITDKLALSEPADVTVKGAGGGENRLLIRDGTAAVTQADCPDHLCVRQKAISKAGESIICLPHKVVITIESEERAEYDAISN